MDINQLVSFVDYQLGQKQGWEALSEVLHKLKEADEQLASAKQLVDLYTKEVEEMKSSLVQMDETAKVKQVELEEKLSAIREAHENASKTNEVALGQEISKKQGECKGLQDAYDNLLKLLEALKIDKQRIDEETTQAIKKYDEIQAKLAQVKASI